MAFRFYPRRPRKSRARTKRNPAVPLSGLPAASALGDEVSARETVRERKRLLAGFPGHHSEAYNGGPGGVESSDLGRLLGDVTPGRNVRKGLE